VKALLRLVLPQGIRDRLRQWHRGAVLRSTLPQLESAAPSSPLPTELLSRLQYAWDNPGWIARNGLLTAIHAALGRTNGPVLECGSGLSTLVLGALTKPLERPVVSLEDNPVWSRRVVHWTRLFNYDHVKVLTKPLRSHGTFDWYDIQPDEIPSNTDLVVVDGPAGDTRGGRIGLLPVLGAQWPSGTVILLDDCVREKERAVLTSWQQMTGGRADLLAGGQVGQLTL